MYILYCIHETIKTHALTTFFYIGSAGCEKVTFSGAHTTISFLCKKVTKKNRN